MRFRVKLGLRGLKDSQKADKGENIHGKMNGNPNFVTPNPDLADFLTGVTEYRTAYENALDNSKPNKAILRTKRAAFNVLYRQLAAYVDNVANGDENIILSAGFETVNPPLSYVMTQVKNVQGVPGLHTGEMIVEWDKVAGAHFYLGYIRVAGETGNKFQLEVKTTGTRGVVNGLQPAGLYEVVIEACGAGVNNVGKLSEVVQVHAAF
jgi:hypothetical protein